MCSNYFNTFPCFFSIRAAAGQMTPAEAELPGWRHSTSSVGSPFHQVSHLRRSEGEEKQAPITMPPFCPPLFRFNCVCYTRHLLFFHTTHLSGASYWGMMRVWPCCLTGPRFPFDWCSFSVSRSDERCSDAAKSQPFSWNIAAILCFVLEVWSASIFFSEG